MAVFFLMVGLEIKREMLDGQLSTWSRRALPGIAAIGGMIVPALIYVAINWGSRKPCAAGRSSATDIAFALGVLALLGSRVPASLKVFLTALAILDDLGAVVIIALFYTSDLSLPMLGLTALTLALLTVLNVAGVTRLAPYLVLGAALWFFVLRSGVHATLAGSRSPDGSAASDARAAEAADSRSTSWSAIQPCGLPDRPGLRLRECRRRPHGSLRGGAARTGSARHRARPVCRQADRRLAFVELAIRLGLADVPANATRSHATGWRSCAASASR